MANPPNHTAGPADLQGSSDLAPPKSPRLLDQIRARMRVLHYSYRTEQIYCHWAKRFIKHSGLRHPREMRAPEVEAFLSYLVTERRVFASTQNQAKVALLFFYKQVLGIEFSWLDEITQAQQRRRLPVVSTARETRLLLDDMTGTKHLVASLLYGRGLRLMEGLRLRAKDLEFERRELIVRAGKGNKDRVTVLPENLIQPLIDHLA